MSKQGKIWGDTGCIYCNDTVSVHAITIKKGGYCSIHKHLFKGNSFYVVSGRLAIEIYNASGVVDRTVLTAGGITTVDPQVKHRFIALDDTEAIEIYDVKFHGDDIIRDDEGGVNA